LHKGLTQTHLPLAISLTPGKPLIEENKDVITGLMHKVDSAETLKGTVREYVSYEI
jgi:hypothetical protein